MRKITPEELKETINCNKIVVVILTQKNCPVCENLKVQVMPEVRKELPLIPFVELEAIANIYPVNELSEQFGFKSVPTVVIYKNGKAVEAITSTHLPKHYITKIQKA